MENQIKNDRLSKSWFIACNMLPPIGFFLYFKHKNQYPNKARRALRGAAMGIPGAIIGGYIVNTFIV